MVAGADSLISDCRYPVEFSFPRWGAAHRHAVKRREPIDDLRVWLATVNGVAGIGDFRLLSREFG